MYLGQKKYCIICGKRLNDGIIINGKGICRQCELMIIQSTSESEDYKYIKGCIKNTIVTKMLKGESENCKKHLF
ncbi:sigma factor G inhibitor Gin [Clostridium sp. DL1XJH146]